MISLKNLRRSFLRRQMSQLGLSIALLLLIEIGQFPSELSGLTVGVLKMALDSVPLLS